MLTAYPTTTSRKEQLRERRALQKSVDREAQKSEIRETLKNSRKEVFTFYHDHLSDELRESIEANMHHGWPHIRRVMAHSLENAQHSEDVVNQPEKFHQFANAVALAERFHDIIQQYLNFLGFEKDSKTFHAELAAVYLLLMAPELRQQGFSDFDVQVAAIMSYYHSEPERLTDEAHFPDFPKLVEWLQHNIAKKLAQGKKIPTTLSEFMPTSSVVTREEIARRLDTDMSLPVQFENSEIQKRVVSWIRKISLSDLMDAIIPSESANLRTSETMEKRAFLVEFNRELTAQVFAEGKEYLIAKLDKAKGDEVGKLEDLLRILLRLEGEVAVEFQKNDQLNPQLELRVRVMSAEMIAKDDFSRILFEILRPYGELHPSAFERAKLAESLHRRLAHLKQMVIELSQGKGAFAEKIFERRLQDLADDNSANNPIYRRVQAEMEHFLHEILPNKFIDPSLPIGHVLHIIQEAINSLDFLGAPRFKHPRDRKKYDPNVTYQEATTKLLPQHGYKQ